MPEKRLVLKHCGTVDPKDITSYLDRDGFKALEKACNEMTPEQVILEVKNSELRGRGGAGFPCGLKWEMAKNAPGDEKYFICNADEGEVGTFKDRYILGNDPFTLIEGIAIACYAIQARKAYVYLREEYHFLLDLLRGSVAQAKEKGLLDHVDMVICEGAGAYVCGEESALMDSIEGKRGEVRYRPPYPAAHGLWGKPTIVNNVETLMNIPMIIRKGAEWFNRIGAQGSRGTKVFSVSGDVPKPGVYELVMGSSLKELVMDLAGAENIKMVQVGGATGRILPLTQMEMPLSYEMPIGSGAVTVFDTSRDVIDVVYRNTEFLAEESCGKCTPCREGSDVLLEILGRMTMWAGTEGDLEALEEISQVMRFSALCGLGQGTPVPLLDTLHHFREEYENRIRQSIQLRRL
jgi:NADH:ubiquinone oxidoreductase subunit F (NADH-binding)